jgi:hypothetical protein
MDVQAFEERLAAVDALNDKTDVSISIEGTSIVVRRVRDVAVGESDDEEDVAYKASGPGGTILSLDIAEFQPSDDEVQDRSRLLLKSHKVGTMAPVALRQVDATYKYILTEEYPLEIRHEHLKRPLSEEERDDLLRRSPGATTVPSLTVITAKPGFEFDRASIPKQVMFIIDKDELSNVPPLFHDLLYRYGGVLPNDQVHPYTKFTREEADNLFDYLMQQCGVKAWKRMAAVAMVRKFGAGSWQAG